MQKVKELISIAKKEKWPYPKTLTDLKRLGIIRYEVTFDVIFNSLYTSNSGAFIEETPVDYVPTEVNSVFSKENVQKALEEHIEKNTSYGSVLAALNRAGVSGYMVDPKNRIVTYHNRDKTETHDEHVPEY